MSDLRTALDQIAFARRYTLGLLDSIDPADWFRMPAEGVTHVAWQVGHLAFAQYRRALARVPGPRPDAAELLPEPFLRLFGRESVPDPDPARYPPPPRSAPSSTASTSACSATCPATPRPTSTHPSSRRTAWRRTSARCCSGAASTS